MTMRVRLARHTERLEEVAAFYRARVGFREVGRFTDHEGYDGVFLDIPNTGAQLELTSGGRHPSPEPHPESLLVLYFDTEAELLAAAQRIPAPEVSPANPYWQRNAKCYADPDRFQVLLTLAGRPAS